MDKRELMNSKGKKFISVKIDPVLYHIENQNIIRSMYINTATSKVKDKPRLLALAILMNSYQSLNSFRRLKEAKDMGNTINWEQIYLIIKDIRSKLPSINISKEDRNDNIINEVNEGISYAAIGRKYGLTGTRINQIYKEYIKVFYKID